MEEQGGGEGDELVSYTTGLLHLMSPLWRGRHEGSDCGAAFCGLSIRPRIKRGRGFECRSHDVNTIPLQHAEVL